VKFLPAICLCLGLILVGCGGGSDSNSSSIATNPAATPNAATRSGVANAEGPGPAIKLFRSAPPKKLVVKNLRTGTGAEAKAGYDATIRYVGVHWNGYPYSNSWTSERAPSFILGTQELTMPGFNKGILGMKVGGRRELILPPRARYGPAGGHRNPKTETLIYVVDLLKVRPRFEKFRILRRDECILAHRSHCPPPPRQ
jgi:peptidylprolyl isomerase